MKLVDIILNELVGAKKSFEIHKSKNLEKYSSGSIRTTLCRLHKAGLIMGEDKTWVLSMAGKKYVNKKQDSFKQFNSVYKSNQIKNLLVMFDIPEIMKAEREWFRWHLKKFNYIMIQKSVWVGPSPLPKEFTDYTKELGLSDAIKTFKLAKDYRNLNK